MMRDIAGLEAVDCPPIIRLFNEANDLSSAELREEAASKGMKPVASFAVIAGNEKRLQDALEEAANETMTVGQEPEQDVRQRLTVPSNTATFSS